MLYDGIGNKQIRNTVWLTRFKIQNVDLVSRRKLVYGVSDQL